MTKFKDVGFEEFWNSKRYVDDLGEVLSEDDHRPGYIFLDEYWVEETTNWENPEFKYSTICGNEQRESDDLNELAEWVYTCCSPIMSLEIITD